MHLIARYAGEKFASSVSTAIPFDVGPAATVFRMKVHGNDLEIVEFKE
jgi:hypothetical protein